MLVATAKLWGMAQADRVDADPNGDLVRYAGSTVHVASMGWDVPTRGTVFATWLNYRGALESRGKSSGDATRAPVLYIKPANTWIPYGAPIPLADGITHVEVGAALGVVISATASRVPIERAMEFIAGYTVVNDVGEPHPGIDVPTPRERCRDGFCAIGPWVIARREVPSPDRLDMRIYVNRQLVCRNTTANMIRSVARTVHEVTAFMTLCAGDVLLMGSPEDAPLVGIGDRVRIEIDGVGSLENPVMAEEPFVAGARP
jgi:5-oxopent-3-ene-1,2,5-tricarboxylate decarboxylase / 2-hydroxyhepta-2,4-diene-1,7-dioate isomerase